MKISKVELYIDFLFILFLYAQWIKNHNSYLQHSTFIDLFYNIKIHIVIESLEIKEKGKKNGK